MKTSRPSDSTEARLRSEFIHGRTPPPIDLRDFIRDIPDFPKPGILFKDITPLLSHPDAFGATIAGLKTDSRAAVST